jgi:hypothetical protein
MKTSANSMSTNQCVEILSRCELELTPYHSCISPSPYPTDLRVRLRLRDRIATCNKTSVAARVSSPLALALLNAV